ncbi:hypothetical protein [Rugamonas aquatica]|uniref:Uncharacterized protein n=1 Tax=Rugamonas aquatica TaxID=2743357 RepID=A0A6A7N4P1_9BURK|nr:hypothetical protein [Rugamonas aquatica]MQA39950.1 hypothetical protein [Rugamonas aquatica]
MEINVPTEIVEAYVFANTPAYLYRKLVASTYVSALNKLSKDNLSELVVRSTNGTVEAVALAYAALLSLLRSGEANLAKELVVKAQLNWANEIILLHQQKNTSVNNAHYVSATAPQATGTPQMGIVGSYRSGHPSSNFVSYSPANS